MSRLGIALAANCLPALVFAQQVDSGVPLSNGYEILSAPDTSSVVVRDKAKYFLCSLTQTQKLYQLTECRPILTVSQMVQVNAERSRDLLEAKFLSIEETVRWNSFLGLFAESPCRTNLGRDPDFEEKVFEEDTDKDDGLPPRQIFLPSLDEIDARDGAVKEYGTALGFNEDEILVLMERLRHQIDWLIQEAILQAIIIPTKIGVFKLSEKCN